MIDPSPSSASSPGILPDTLTAATATSDDPPCRSTCEIGSLTLRHGGVLPRVRMAYELCGPVGAPLVVVQGGISAGRHVTATSSDPSPGWWQELVGPGLAVDTRRFRVLAFDYLGGNGESTGPRQSRGMTLSAASKERLAAFPTVGTDDQARALTLLLDRLQLGPLAAYVGSSYGGMVGLAFAALSPNSLQRLIVISAAHRPHPQATAWRSLQRNIVTLARRSGRLHEGLVLARGLAMTTYRTPHELRQRFDTGPTVDDAGDLRFPVEGYLEARGEAFAESFDADAFLTLSKSIDLHRIEADAITAPTQLIAVTSDQLVPVDSMQELARSLPQGVLHEIDSLYGHDAFLKETQQIGALVHRGLNLGDHTP